MAEPGIGDIDQLLAIATQQQPWLGVGNCPGCGRFARVVAERHFYDGTWDQYQFTTACGKCGQLDTECV